jgi:hypothetical protein
VDVAVHPWSARFAAALIAVRALLANPERPIEKWIMGAATETDEG